MTNPALEDRVVKALVAEGLVRRGRPPAALVALAVAAALLVAVLWPRPHTNFNPRYVLLLTMDSAYIMPPHNDLRLREHEYALWADSLARLGKLDLAGKLLGHGDVQGMFLIRAANDSDAARIAATCPHIKYRGHIEVRRFVE